MKIIMYIIIIVLSFIIIYNKNSFANETLYNCYSIKYDYDVKMNVPFEISKNNDMVKSKDAVKYFINKSFNENKCKIANNSIKCAFNYLAPVFCFKLSDVETDKMIDFLYDNQKIENQIDVLNMKYNIFPFN